jgi:hypothetical protein
MNRDNNQSGCDACDKERELSGSQSSLCDRHTRQMELWWEPIRRKQLRKQMKSDASVITSKEFRSCQRGTEEEQDWFWK